MNIGSLNKRITIQQQSTTPDSWGQPAQAWADVCMVWASLSDISGKEFIAGQAEQSEVTSRAFIRKRSGITAGMRIVYGGILYDIQAVLDDGNSRQLQLMCKRL